jgi:hypothetical protein
MTRNELSQIIAESKTAIRKQQKTLEEQTKRSHQPTSTDNSGTRQRAL